MPNQEKVWRRTFTAIGSGKFPFDMLRYDCCYPADGESAELLRKGEFPVLGRTEIRIVCVKLTSDAMPTVARWNSFGWGIDELED